jgi:hypothetical protein
MLSKEEERYMLTDVEEQIIQLFAIAIPKLSESKKEYLRGIGEGMILGIDKQEKGQSKLTS